MSPAQLSDFAGARWQLFPFPAGVSPEKPWGAKLQDADVSKGGFLHTEVGGGATPEEAMEDYCRKVAGKTLVIGSFERARREVKVPAAEPKLPDQIGVAHLTDRNGDHPALNWPGSGLCPVPGLESAVYREAVARYNAVGHVLGWLGDPSNPGDVAHTLAEILRDERERLEK